MQIINKIKSLEILLYALLSYEIFFISHSILLMLNSFYYDNIVRYTDYNQWDSNLFVFFVNNFRLFVSLKPHHVFCMKPPTLFLQSFRRQVLTLGTFHVIKYKKQCFRRKTLEEFYSIRMRKLYLCEKILQTSNFVILPHPILSLFYTPVDSKVA